MASPLSQYGFFNVDPASGRSTILQEQTDQPGAGNPMQTHLGTTSRNPCPQPFQGFHEKRNDFSRFSVAIWILPVACDNMAQAYLKQRVKSPTCAAPVLCQLCMKSASKLRASPDSTATLFETRMRRSWFIHCNSLKPVL